MIKTNTSRTTNNNINFGNSILEVKSKYDAEFRRFGLNKQKLSRFDEFYKFLERLHGLFDIQFIICYTDRDGELLPINNDCNYNRVLNVTVGILRLIIQRKGECYDQNLTSNYHHNSNSNNNKYNKNSTNIMSQIKSIRDLTSSHNQLKPIISYPEDFRPVSAIIDVDIVPETYRRVRLHKHKSSKPLGFYIRDGRSIRVTPNGVEQVPSIFISRLMPGGLAESTGLLSVNDEVIEVNGIEVAGKTLDQVTDMMIANSSNLIITVKPANQRYNLNRSQLNDSRLTNQNIPSSKSGPSLSGGSSLSSNSSFANSFNNKTRTSSLNHKTAAAAPTTTTTLSLHNNNSHILTSNNNNITNSTSNYNINNIADNSINTSSTTSTNNSTSAATSTLNNNNQNNSNNKNNTQNTNIPISDDDDDDDEEVHDPNSNDDKILTL